MRWPSGCPGCCAQLCRSFIQCCKGSLKGFELHWWTCSWRKAASVSHRASGDVSVAEPRQSAKIIDFRTRKRRSRQSFLPKRKVSSEEARRVMARAGLPRVRPVLPVALTRSRFLAQSFSFFLRDSIDAAQRRRAGEWLPAKPTR
jgi:hypothetical protein